MRLTYEDSTHTYEIDDEPVPSVTQILDKTTPKDALTWWGMRVGFAAVISLIQEGKLSGLVLPTLSPADHISGIPLENPEQFVQLGKKKKTVIEAEAVKAKLTTNHIRDKAANVGTLIHDALEQVGITGKLPMLSEYPEQFRGYLQAFAKFWLEQDPIILQQEVIVGSTEHMYAGRFDLAAEISDDKTLIDYKTSKGIYESHSEQLVLYDVAYGETYPAEEPFSRLAVVHLRPDGEYAMYDTFTSKRTAAAAVELFQSRAVDNANKPKGWGGR